ncbi:hypothetical protein LMG8286_01280 [Campylobacter suis]|uniref:Autotransporter domain-containing protein n=1 Tax=Campylobacter suis TaxID=2790657 RepID=A0ABM8Q668_9BACT|nr:hypothetical protein LMG8286_01280 [Campylobacter suis]
MPLRFDGAKTKALSANLALEFRKYTQNGSYFYITPGVSRELYKNSDDTNVRFVGVSDTIALNTDDKKKTYATINTGADFKLSEALKLNVNFGAKAKSKENYYNGTIGLRYSF